MKKLLIFMGLLSAFTMLIFVAGCSTAKDAHAVEVSSNADEDDADGNGKKRKTKEVIKDSTAEVLNSIVEETIRAIGDSIVSSIDSSGAKEGNDTYRSQPSENSEQSRHIEAPVNQGRRQKPSRW